MGGTPVSPRSRKVLSILFRLLVIAGGVFLVSRYLPSSPLHSISSIAHLPVHGPGTSEGIPRKIWQLWLNPVNLVADEDKKRVWTWHEKNPNFKYELMTDQSAETYVRQHFVDEPLLRDVFLNLTDAILRADFLRYLILSAEGGMYADLDVECRKPIDTWVPPAFQNRTSAVIGIENDREPVGDDVKLYHDNREHIWGIANWALMSKRRHPFLGFVARTVAESLMVIAQGQNRTLGTIQLSYKQVIDTTGPGAFTQAFLKYASKVTGTDFTSANATMLEEPKLIDDILILPIRAFSTVEANRNNAEGAHSRSWPAVIYHWSAGTWKKTHS